MTCERVVRKLRHALNRKQEVDSITHFEASLLATTIEKRLFIQGHPSSSIQKTIHDMSSLEHARAVKTHTFTNGMHVQLSGKIHRRMRADITS